MPKDLQSDIQISPTPNTGFIPTVSGSINEYQSPDPLRPPTAYPYFDNQASGIINLMYTSTYDTYFWNYGNINNSGIIRDYNSKTQKYNNGIFANSIPISKENPTLFTPELLNKVGGTIDVFKFLNGRGVDAHDTVGLKNTQRSFLDNHGTFNAQAFVNGYINQNNDNITNRSTGTMNLGWTRDNPYKHYFSSYNYGLIENWGKIIIENMTLYTQLAHHLDVHGKPIPPNSGGGSSQLNWLSNNTGGSILLKGANSKLYAGAGGLIGNDSGTISGEGTIVVARAPFYDNNPLKYLDGIFTTSGRLAGSLTIEAENTGWFMTGGELSPGQGTGDYQCQGMSFYGDWNREWGGSIDKAIHTIQIKSTTKGKQAQAGFDWIDVEDGNVDLTNVDLNLSIINGFKPGNGDSFDFLQVDSQHKINGTYNNLPEGATVPYSTSGADLPAGTSGAPNLLITYKGGDGNDVMIHAADLNIVRGTDDNDTLTGTSANDHLQGGSGNDLIYCSSSLSTLGGNDAAYGGEGDDTFILTPGDGSLTIRDYNPDDDQIKVIGSHQTIQNDPGVPISIDGTNANVYQGNDLLAVVANGADFF